MWKVREARLNGEGVVFVPAGGLALPGGPSLGIGVLPEQCSGGKDSAVKSVELFAGAGGLSEPPKPG